MRPALEFRGILFFPSDCSAIGAHISCLDCCLARLYFFFLAGLSFFFFLAVSQRRRNGGVANVCSFSRWSNRPREHRRVGFRNQLINCVFVSTRRGEKCWKRKGFSRLCTGLIAIDGVDWWRVAEMWVFSGRLLQNLLARESSRWSSRDTVTAVTHC